MRRPHHQRPPARDSRVQYAPENQSPVALARTRTRETSADTDVTDPGWLETTLSLSSVNTLPSKLTYRALSFEARHHGREAKYCVHTMKSINARQRSPRFGRRATVIHRVAPAMGVRSFLMGNRKSNRSKHPIVLTICDGLTTLQKRLVQHRTWLFN